MGGGDTEKNLLWGSMHNPKNMGGVGKSLNIKFYEGVHTIWL